MPFKEGNKLQHRDRKNGAAREEWQKRKAAANASRVPQIYNEESKTWAR